MAEASDGSGVTLVPFGALTTTPVFDNDRTRPRGPLG